eukprot:COSAG01_NODE_2061_length_8482_cov_6.301925_2_plen_89_part_00
MHSGSIIVMDDLILSYIYILRVRVEIMGPGRYENVGKSQSVLIVINPMIFTRTRTLERVLGGDGFRRRPVGAPCLTRPRARRVNRAWR